jgi:hypothetical protein
LPALLPKEYTATCQNEHGDGSDPVLQQSVVTLASRDRTRASFQSLQIVAQFGGFLSGIYPAYFSNKEPISSLWNRLDVSGIFGVIVQRLPKLTNGGAEAAVEVNKSIARPEAAAKFLAADDFSGSFEEYDKEP